jgi:hypothetical protein
VTSHRLARAADRGNNTQSEGWILYDHGGPGRRPSSWSVDPGSHLHEEGRVTEADLHTQVGEALMLLIDGLGPFVEQTMRAVLPPEVTWTSVLERKDRVAGRRGGVYSPGDLSLLLRVLTERLGELGYPFDGLLTRQAQAYAREMREVRNQWAHNQPFAAPAAYRAVDSAELLLRSIGAIAPADALAALKQEVLPVRPLGDIEQPQSTAPVVGEQKEINSAADTDVAATPLPSSELISITIGSLPYLSYALAHCRIPVVNEIVIHNEGTELRGASLEVDVVSAHGSHGGPKVLLLDLGEGQTTTLRPVDLVLDPARMIGVEEQRPALIRATLRNAAGELLLEQSVDVQLLAHNQWIAKPLELGLELLAAHVQPNSRSIIPLLVEASDLLRVRTGDSALSGYQHDNPERVDQTVAALFDAMRARDIRYAEPPASWGSTGQKVRTPAEVLDDRLGTCLDTTVCFAAALEQAGINSTLWLLEGHIFLGYWRVDNSLGAVTITDVVEVVNLVDLGLIALLETTALTGGPESRTFDEARRGPHVDHLSGDLSRFLGVTDVRQAREAQIFPLPSRSLDAEGHATVAIYHPRENQFVADYGHADASHASISTKIPPRVTQWKNALLDLSLRNRLINYTERSGYSMAVPAPAVSRLEDAINAHTPITLVPSDHVATVDQARGVRFGRDLSEQSRVMMLADKKSVYIDVTEASYSTKLRYLAYKAKTIIQETGANNLYLAFGMLVWRFNDRELRSPLVLVPVSLTTTSRGATYRLTIDEAGASTPNYCLLEKLRASVNLQIPGLANPVEDASGIDLRAAFDACREAIASAGLPFRVEETVELSILQFAKFRLWKDLDENWQSFATNSLVSHLVNSPLDSYKDPSNHDGAADDLDELGASMPAPADASQLEAVSEAAKGRTFVLQGPPGTGKSQTITNLIAHALTLGQSVLFVAEKRAALDVVRDRLEAVGLGPFTLDLHDKSARPAAVRAQLRAALDIRTNVDVDALKASRENVMSSGGTLTRYAQRLHETNGAGYSLYSARAGLLAADPTLNCFDIPIDFISASASRTVDELQSVLRSLPEVADLARPSRDHPWGFVDERAGSPLDAAAAHQSAQRLQHALAATIKSGRSLETLTRARTPEALGQWAELASAPRFDRGELQAAITPAVQTDILDLVNRLTAIRGSQPDWATVLRPEAIRLDVESIHQSAIAADSSSVFGRKKRRRAVLARIAPAFRPDGRAVALKSLSTLTAELVAARQDASALFGSAARLPVRLVDDQWNPFDRAHSDGLLQTLGWLRILGAALSTKTDHTADLWEYYAATPAGTAGAELGELARAWSGLRTAFALSPEAETAWSGTRGFLPLWWSTAHDRNVPTAQPITLDRWLQLVRHVEPLRAVGLDSARAALLDGSTAVEDAVLAFNKGLAQTSIKEREEANALANFDAVAQNKSIHRFTAGTREIRTELPRSMPADMLTHRRFNQTSDSGQVGGLRRQLDRQRGGMSVRALLENYGGLITQITPCALVSPESVSRFFPAQASLFDIVVFDEASQIRVADAIGTMGRANSVVVVGDSKQMPPTSFAESSATIDEDTQPLIDVVQDEESILTECVQARVPSKWLSWHYRSQDESLIAFSNHHYYDDRLSSFPAPVHERSDAVDGYGISLVRVNGTFDRAGKGKALRTNRREAEVIVEEVERRFWSSPDAFPSLGIITFNAQQRDLIENMLRDSGNDRITHALDEPDGLFVKNLENVQGDERDCILFSVAFSANERGVLSLNFGPLTRAGGERRLNVAITRARRQVLVFASFAPEELRAQDTSSLGLKDLRAYLELADRGVTATGALGVRQSVVDRHRDEIAHELQLLGLAVRTDVGLSDFRVDLCLAKLEEPDRPLVAVLLDGPSWRARRTVSDRDGLPVEVLKNMMRWHAVERVWLPAWLQDRQSVLSRLVAAVAIAEDAVNDPSPPALTGARSTSIHEEQDVSTRTDTVVPIRGLSPARVARTTPPASAGSPFVRTFAEWVPLFGGTTDVLDQLPGRGATDKVQTVIRSAIDAEGPIHKTRMARLVAGSFGLHRVASSRTEAILAAVPSEYRRRGDQDFFWPTNIDPAQWFTVRTCGTVEGRPLDFVALEEIANAMCVVAQEAAGISNEELKREALLLFGSRRLTTGLGTRLSAALEFGVSSGRLERTSGGLLVSGRR